ncbi:Two-component sensor histidine kinase, contains HisKA and HATPase domains [Arboricoccus pini]|uniref:histidine kinase n=2 Tax=Arboricoccus pini TaxID=1963835 RepID=A0A212QY57_9PROT|nr:Two-component sensor histidine kinase, contains HisKA and HATPase domains [Arboricoccus pini]
MALLMGLVLVAPATYAVIKAVQAYLDQSAGIKATLQRSARAIATADAAILDRQRATLERVAAAPGLDIGDSLACSDQIAHGLTGLEDFSWLVIVDGAGRVRCSSNAELLTRDPGAHAYLGALEQGATFVVGKLEDDALLPGGKAVKLAVGLRQGRSGAVLGAVPADHFNAALPALDLPDGALLYLLDSGGNLLSGLAAANPDKLQQGALATLLKEPGRPSSLQMEDQPRRLFVAEPVLGGRMYVVVGLPSPRWSWLESDLVIGIFAPTSTLMLAIVAIWVVTDLLINRHIRALAITARAYSRGQLNMPVSLRHAPTELRELGATLARMAERVQRRETELETSLRQKDALLKEIHHRVKNNLQIVTSLLNLRARAQVTPAASEAMLDAQLRIKAMALVHRNLYEHDDVGTVQLGKFLGELGEMLREFRREGDGGIDLRVEAPTGSISTDQAIPMALLVTEAVSNAFQHGFPDRTSGQVKVELTHEGDNKARLLISDDGIGLAAGRARGAARERAGIGLTLISLLAKQMGGKLEIEEGAGTRLRIDFVLRREATSLVRAA